MPVHTRRQSKEAHQEPVAPETTEAAHDGAEPIPEEQENEGEPAMAAIIEVTVPEELFSTLHPLFPSADLAHPSPDLILSLYQTLADNVAQLAQHTDLAAQVYELIEAKESAEVQAQDSEVAVREHMETIAALEEERDTAVEKAQKDDGRISQLETENTQLKAQLEEVKNTTDASGTNVGDLRKEVSELEDSKRRLLDMNQRLSEETQYQKSTLATLEKSLRETNSNLIDKESRLASAEAKEGMARAKNQALEEEIELLRGEISALKEDAAKQMEDWGRTRRDMNSRQAKTEEENARLTAQLSQVQMTYTQLRASHDNLTATHHKAISDLAELKATHESLQFQFQSSMVHWEDLRKALDKRAEELRDVVQSMEGEWDHERDQWREKVQLAENEGIKERESLAAAHARIEQLEHALDEVGGGGPENGQSLLSQSALLAIRAQKSGRTFSDIYTALIKTEEQLRREKEEHEALKAAFDSVVGQLAEKQPEIQQRTANYDKLEAQLLDLTQRLSRALSIQDETAEELRRAKALAAEDKSTITGLKSSVVDLSRQVRALVREVAIRDDPLLVNETHPEFQAGWPADRRADDVAETADDVVNQAVVFTDLRQLQERNVLLLRMIRRLGQKLEEEENNWEDEEKEALREAEDAIEALQEQVERKNTLIDSLKSESERWRQMAARQGHGDALQVSQSQALALQQSQLRESTLDVSVASHRTAEEDETRRDEEKRWREDVSKQMDNLREENGRLLKEQGTTVVELARAKAQVEIVNDRLKSAQDEISRKRAENDELAKRASAMQTSYAQLEAHLTHLTGEHEKIEGRMNIMNNEVHNLRAEKESWKRYEANLQKQVDELAKGKVDLNVTLRQMQSTLSGLQASHDNTVHRLSTQLADAQSRNYDMQSMLNTETQRLRIMQSDNERSTKVMQDHVDQLKTELQEAKEKMQQAESERDQRVVKVDELQKLLDAVNEQLSVYRRSEEGGPEEGASREDRLQAEVGDLRAKLKTAQTALQAAKAQVEQYTAIAQANEEALASANETAKEYERSTASEIQKRDVEIHKIRDNLSLATQQLTTSQEEADTIRHELHSKQSQWDEERKMLESMVAEHAQDEARFLEERDAQREEIKRLTELVGTNDEKYRRELIAHGDAEKNVMELNSKLRKLQTDIAKYQSDTATAIANLKASEASWEEQRAGLKQQITHFESRIEQSNQRNRELQDHLSTLNEHIVAFRQADPTTATNGASLDASADARITQLEAVNAYLRSEKDLLDADLKLQRGNITRMESTVTWQKHQIEDLESQLSAERSKAAEAVSKAAQHQDLLSKVNDLSAFQESNTLLRQQKDEAVKGRNDAEQKIRDLQAALAPLKQQVIQDQAELQARAAQVKSLEDDLDRWKTRTNAILTTQDRVDPEEHKLVVSERDEVKTTLERIKGEMEQLKTDAEQDKSRNNPCLTIANNIPSCRTMPAPDLRVSRRSVTSCRRTSPRLSKRLLP
ncbi:hypothetical protein CALVIDRAFT_244818 [Calocera viscosa TUFC12733]|uniref:Uncharacterized protein n=1 Tax=Calocera viscosa (strain TUFC12733) TaxID=1330018 RepID=A0A167JGV6_CALVF|nr:hypothetical protein CALVIDRAFT_244818 [Calocera viscosa TUFC12733]